MNLLHAQNGLQALNQLNQLNPLNGMNGMLGMNGLNGVNRVNMNMALNGMGGYVGVGGLGGCVSEENPMQRVFCPLTGTILSRQLPVPPQCSNLILPHQTPPSPPLSITAATLSHLNTPQQKPIHKSLFLNKKFSKESTASNDSNHSPLQEDLYHKTQTSPPITPQFWFQTLTNLK